MIRFFKTRELSIVLLMVAYILLVGAFNQDSLQETPSHFLLKQA